MQLFETAVQKIVKELEAQPDASSSGSVGKFIGTLCAIPVWVCGLSVFLVGRFVASSHSDAANMKRLIGVEWPTFVVLLGIPLITCILSLLVQSDDWWQITLLVYFSSVTVYCVAFALAIVVLEVQAAACSLKALQKQQQQQQQQGPPTVPDKLASVSFSSLLKLCGRFTVYGVLH